MAKRKHIIVSALLIIVTVTCSVIWFMTPPLITKGETVSSEQIKVLEPSTKQAGKHVVVYLQKMLVELRDGDTLVATLPVLSQGKPGSYYETIGGVYTNDYKTRLHFSSIGYVYMPYSVHVFGNYFIHGVPYYPNGKEVSSTHSGGCVRLSNTNAEILYNFVDKGTVITITRDVETSFEATKEASTTLTSIEMTNLMTAMISLEFLTQDDPVIDPTNGSQTTRQNLLPRLIKDGDTSVAHLYAKNMGEVLFIKYMNQKAEAIGLHNTRFTSLDSEVSTTYEDYMRFMTYVTTYKSYLRTLQ